MPLFCLKSSPAVDLLTDSFSLDPITSMYAVGGAISPLAGPGSGDAVFLGVGGWLLGGEGDFLPVCCGVKPLVGGGTDPLICMPATLSARLRDRERERTWALPGAVAPTALVVVTCVVEGAGEVGREGRLRIGRVRRAFMAIGSCPCDWERRLELKV
jgi:hypothetical protein